MRRKNACTWGGTTLGYGQRIDGNEPAGVGVIFKCPCGKNVKLRKALVGNYLMVAHHKQGDKIPSLQTHQANQPKF